MERPEPLLAIVREANVEACFLEEEPHRVAVLDLVVDDEDGVPVIGQRLESSAASFG